MPREVVDAPRFNFILDNISDDNLDILDIGCWDGAYTMKYKMKSNIVYGVEISKKAVNLAKKNGIKVINGDFMSGKFFSNKKFDVIIAGEIIEHVFDTDLFLRKIRAMLKKSGRLILTTPNVASLPRRILLLIGINPSLENRTLLNESAGHIRYFTFKDIYRILKDNNFTIIQSKSDVLNFNNQGTCFSTLIPKIYKRFGKSIMVVAKVTNNE